MSQEPDALRIGVLWRGDRRAEAPLPRADWGLGPLYDAFARLPVVVEPVAYSDDAAEEVTATMPPVRSGSSCRPSTASWYG
jgi:hypothetical protein